MTIATFSEHLQGLKKLFILNSVIGLVLLIVNFFSAQYVLGFITGKYHVISIKPSDSLISLFSIDFTLTIIFMFGISVWSVLKYISPALKDSKHLNKIFLTSLALFYAGCSFGFYIYAPTVLNYLASVSIGLSIQNSWQISYLVSFLFSTTLLFGLAFQIPLISSLLVYYNITEVKSMLKWSIPMIPIIMIISAWITPPDVISMLMMFAPILLLYYIGLLFSLIIRRSKNVRTI